MQPLRKEDYTRLSEAISWIRFPLIFLIILLHCYSTVKLPGNHVMYFKAIYPFSLWLGETGVPGFFFISGFLFFHSKKTHRQKISSRIHTLLIPYLLWNLILLGLYVVAFLVGWIPVERGVGTCVAIVLGEIAIAFVIWFCYLLYYRNLGRKMDARIQQIKKE